MRSPTSLVVPALTGVVFAVGACGSSSSAGSSHSSSTSTTSTTSVPLRSSTSSTTVPQTKVAPVTPVTERWSTPATIDRNEIVRSVSCASPSFCVAVDDTGHEMTYDGASWSAPREVDAAGAGLGPSAGIHISCPTSSFCEVFDNGGYALSYKGSTWSAPVRIDGTPGGNDGKWVSLSCASASFCLETDSSGYSFAYNGSAWKAGPRFEKVPAGSYGVPSSVSCTSAHFCMVVAGAKALTFNGSTWSTPITVGKDLLGSVSCPTATFCAAGSGSAVYTYRDGKWTAAQHFAPANWSTFISCTSSTLCAALSIGPPKDSAAESNYNGSAWSRPVSIRTGGFLTSISCVSASFCAAVGNYVGSGVSWAMTRGHAPSQSVPATVTPTSLIRCSGPLSLSHASVSFAGMLVDYSGGPNSVGTAGNLSVLYQGHSVFHTSSLQGFPMSIAAPETAGQLCIAKMATYATPVALAYMVGGAGLGGYVKVVYPAAAGNYSATDLAADLTYRLSVQHLGGSLALLAPDPRFSYLFADGAGSVSPVLVERFQGGRLVDVSRQFHR